MRARPVLTLLDTNGDGTGLTNANGDYSANPGIFYSQPPPGEDWAIVDFDITMITDEIDPVGYGPSSSPLPNGITVLFYINGVLYPGAGGALVQRNRSWVAVGDNTEFVRWGLPVDDEMMRCRISVGEFYTDPDMPKPYAGQAGILLQGHRGDYIAAILRDDHTDLGGHYFLTRGARYYDHISRANTGGSPTI